MTRESGPLQIAGEPPGDFICRILRSSGNAKNPPVADPSVMDAVMAAARSEGIAPLLAGRLRGSPGVPGRLSAALKRHRLQVESLELLREPGLRQLLDALAATGIDALLMKGAALAYSLYASPGLRPRTDTDILIRQADIAGLRMVLADLGYQVPAGDTGSALNYQFIASRLLANGQSDAVDVHWRINNRLEFARLFDFEELSARRLPLQELGPAAFGLGLGDSLLLACLHRVGHLNEGDPERLIWLYDIHLLVEALDETAEAEFIAPMQAKQLTAVCDAGIGKAAGCFGTRVPPRLAEALRLEQPGEPSRRLLGAGPLRTVWIQYLAQPDWRHRSHFVRELAFPPRDHMRRKYPESRSPLWWLYVRRGFDGLRKRLRRGEG